MDDIQRLIEAAQTPEDLERLERLIGAPAPVVANPWTVKTLGQVAEFFDLESQTIREWRTGRNPMPGREGQWDLREIVKWRCDRLKANAVQAKSARVVELEERSLELEVAKKELAHQLARGDLVERSAAKQTVREILNRVRTDVETIPSELGPSIPQELRAELTHQMAKKLELILTKMSQARGPE